MVSKNLYFEYGAVQKRVSVVDLEKSSKMRLLRLEKDLKKSTSIRSRADLPMFVQLRNQRYPSPDPPDMKQTSLRTEGSLQGQYYSAGVSKMPLLTSAVIGIFCNPKRVSTCDA